MPDYILITRLPPEAAELVAESVPLDYHPIPRLAVAYPGERKALGRIVVATGGTSDMPVAEEAALTAEVLGNRVTRLYDVGVAGLHRLLSNLEPLMSARWRCPPAWAMGPTSAGCPPCWPCSIPAPPGAAW